MCVSMPNTAAERVRVAVGVIHDGKGRILVARRAAHLHQGGLWEFPGGKIGAGESTYEALCRELHEELGISVSQAEPLLLIDHDYRDKSVRLDVWNVNQFSGEPHGREGQPLRWDAISELQPGDFPAANAAIIDALVGRFRSTQ